MTVDWLGTQTTKRGVNLAPLNEALSRLEGTFNAAAQRRQDIMAKYGNMPTARDAALGDLRATFDEAVMQAKADIQAAFKQARDEAAEMQTAAYGDFARSREGDAYRATMQMYSPLADRLNPDDLAARIDRAARAGLVGEARALAELAALHSRPTAKLRGAAMNSDTRTDAERAADDAAAKLDAARARFAAFSGRPMQTRTEAIFGGSTSLPYPGAFSPAVILDGQPLENETPQG